VWPSSRCPDCGAPIKAFDNVPLVSYLVLRGRCRICKARISPRYRLVAPTGTGAPVVAGAARTFSTSRSQDDRAPRTVTEMVALAAEGGTAALGVTEPVAPVEAATETSSPAAATSRYRRVRSRSEPLSLG
jgi:prepilin signal peptidase PulO-like enzyme (type II secretory pathway)